MILSKYQFSLQTINHSQNTKKWKLNFRIFIFFTLYSSINVICRINKANLPYSILAHMTKIMNGTCMLTLFLLMMTNYHTIMTQIRIYSCFLWRRKENLSLASSKLSEDEIWFSFKTWHKLHCWFYWLSSQHGLFEFGVSFLIHIERHL